MSQAYYGLILAEQGKDAAKEARTYLSDTRNRINRLLQINSPNVRETDQFRLAVYEGAVDKFAAQADEGSQDVLTRLSKLSSAMAPARISSVPTELPNPAAAPSPLDT